MLDARALLSGLRAPLDVFLRARAAGEPGRAYLRLVRWQLLLVTLVMAVATPSILSGIHVADTDEETEIHVDRSGLRVSHHRRPPDKPSKAAKEPSSKKTSQKDEPTPPPSRLDEMGKKLDELGQDLEAKAEEQAEEKAEGVHVAGDGFVSRYLPRLRAAWLAIVALYAAWLVAELFIYALYREHIDHLSDELARAVGLPVRARQDARPPRVRLDLGWVKRRLMRQVLSAIVLASGAPFFLAARVLPRIGHGLYVVTLTGWGLYWLLVTTAGKSEAAWTEPATRPPWFRRFWTELTTSMPGFRWWLPRTYGRLWKRLTERLDRAAELAERQPWAFAGLSVARIAGNLPVVSILVRPLLPVAATAIVRDKQAPPGGPC